MVCKTRLERERKKEIANERHQSKSCKRVRVVRDVRDEGKGSVDILSNLSKAVMWEKRREEGEEVWGKSEI